MTRPTVVHVVRSDAFAGVERYIAETANELARRGWAVSVIGGDAVSMRRHLADAVGHRPATTTHEVHRALRELGRRDIVHAHMTAAELPAARLKRRLHARLVVTRHFATPRGGSVAGRLAGRFIEPRIDLQIAISTFVAEATSSPCVVVHSGVQSSDARVRRGKIVVMMQRLEPEKDTSTALRAWAASGLASEGWRLMIYGRGSEQAALQSVTRARSIEDSVTFAGFTPDARGALRGAEIMLASAIAEPFGLAVVEAMAEGTPVVATEAGAHPETLGADAAYFPPGDVETCAVQLQRLARSPEQRRAIGDRSQQRQRRLFSIESHVDRLERLYQDQLSGRGQSKVKHGR
jgi:glycosyltransferase involved in cell wall biosynthesis